MSFRTRFVLLAGFNCLFILAGLWLSLKYNVDLSQRLIDLDLGTTKGLFTLLSFMTGMIVAFLTNFALLSFRKANLPITK